MFPFNCVYACGFGLREGGFVGVVWERRFHHIYWIGHIPTAQGCCLIIYHIWYSGFECVCVRVWDMVGICVYNFCMFTSHVD